jgi:lipoate-protein ligase A
VLRLVSDRFDPPWRDTAVSAAVLTRVASGEDPGTLRVWVPERAVAFGRQDRSRPGYRDAVRAVTELGYAPVERLAGGRAAVFHPETVAFAWTVPDASGPLGIRPRFAVIAGIVSRALQGLGLDARVGEIPGEYCPGEWSVNLEGTHKVMGVGQRLVRGAAHVGGVIVVADATAVNAPLLPAYRHLGYEWRPEATGALDRSAAAPGIAAVMAALLAEFAASAEETVAGSLDPACLKLADTLAPVHDAALTADS